MYAQFCVVSRSPHVKVRPLAVRIGHPFDSAFWGDDWMPSETLALPEPFIVETVLSIAKSARLDAAKNGEQRPGGTNKKGVGNIVRGHMKSGGV
jgi:hypothetical protein